MLVKLTDVKGRPVWINPIHVKGVRQRSKATEIYVAFNASFGQISVKVKEPAEDVVELLNMAMPDLLPLPPMEDERRKGGGAAAAAMMG